MENAVSALKLAASVFIFLLGLAILFNMTAQAKEVARILISESDKTEYYTYYEGDTTIDANGNRTVTFDEIIPALYRYNDENYGVTIVDDHGQIVGRFDSDTERICNNWTPNASKEGKFKFVLETKMTYDLVNELANGLTPQKTNIDIESFYEPPMSGTEQIVDGVLIGGMITEDGEDKIVELFNRLYGQQTRATVNRERYCYWQMYPATIAQRVDSDLSRNTSIF